MLRSSPAGDFANLDRRWRELALSTDEEIWLEYLQQRFPVLKSMARGILVLAILFQIRYLVPWANQFSTGIHALILVGWNLGLVSLAFVYFGSSMFSSGNSRREMFHNLIFMYQLSRMILIFSGVVFTVIAVICGYDTQGLHALFFG